MVHSKKYIVLSKILFGHSVYDDLLAISVETWNFN